MNRRALLRSMALSSIAFALPNQPFAASATDIRRSIFRKGSFSMDGNKIRFSHPEISKPFNVTMIADTHLFRDDARGSAFAQYSGRMSKAYNLTRHFQTGREINPEIAFEETIRIAEFNRSELVALVGDIFSFPSEAAIEWVLEKMEKTPLPYVYTAGNHDWHYEGMQGSSAYLRREWIKKRLTPFYQGRDPMMQKMEINGVNFIVIDNSTYEISESQLDFFRKTEAEKNPAVLMLHIPLYAPGRSVGFGCGHPDWGERSDRSYTLERREPWRVGGHTSTTMAFYEAVFQSENLLGVLAGHIHNQSVDIINGIPQIVTESNAEGGFLEIGFYKN